jgi:hypothetical protein
MALPVDVVVVAVHRLVDELEGFPDLARERRQRGVEHLPAVLGGVVLRPADRLDVVGEEGGALDEIREIAIRQAE